MEDNDNEITLVGTGHYSDKLDNILDLLNLIKEDEDTQYLESTILDFLKNDKERVDFKVDFEDNKHKTISLIKPYQMIMSDSIEINTLFLKALEQQGGI